MFCKWSKRTFLNKINSVFTNSNHPSKTTLYLSKLEIFDNDTFSPSRIKFVSYCDHLFNWHVFATTFSEGGFLKSVSSHSNRHLTMPITSFMYISFHLKIRLWVRFICTLYYSKGDASSANKISNVCRSFTSWSSRWNISRYRIDLPCSHNIRNKNFLSSPIAYFSPNSIFSLHSSLSFFIAILSIISE